jgi:hypothetical protein
VDSAINKLVMFKGSMYAGGKFKYGYAWPQTELNGIARVADGLGVKDIPGAVLTLEFFPNPVRAGGAITVSNDFKASQFVLTDLSGKKLTGQSISKPSQQVALPSLAPGIYFAEAINEKGERAVKKIVVE